VSDDQPRRRANDLDGSEWTRSSVSVWSDIRKTPEETALKHPAMFPVMLVERVIRCFTTEAAGVVLDPFSGSGSTLVAASRLGKRGIGFEVAPEYARLTRERLEALGCAPETGYELHAESGGRVAERLAPASVDLCVTSPPYWDILARKRTADYRDVRDYEPGDGDLSRITEYDEFIGRLGEVFDGVFEVLKPGGYCVVNVMDLRKKDRFYPLHSDLARRLDREHKGPFIFDDLIIWDRRADYNNLRPLGYPAVFRINKVHEFLLIFRKPR
jgi:DNA modification methylase